MSSLIGKTALVTGASRGIGRAIALRLAADGAYVGVHYGRSKREADETIRMIEDQGGNAVAVGANLAVIAEIEAMYERLGVRFDNIDILVNNAATLLSLTIDNTTPEDFDKIVNTNLRGTYFVTKYAMARMGKGGRIINVASNSTRVAYPEVSVYGLTKAAIQNLTLSLAQQLGPRGITVNTLIPGIIDTDMNANWLSAETKTFVEGITALGRLGAVQEVASVAAFLASEESSWVTAQNIEVSGGCRL